MPIYEFYCPDCHTVFSFFSTRVDPDRQPDCPRCARPQLARRPSRFATLKHAGGEEADPLDAFDDQQLEGAMETLMREAEGVDEDDPRAMGKMMRRFSELTGLEMGDRMAELVRRMEAGEDPERLEEEMETAFGGDGEGGEDGEEGEGSFADFFKLKQALGERRSRKPRIDDELYFF